LQTREVTNDVAAIIHHPTPFRSANRCRGARGCVGDEGEERGAKGEEGAARVGWNCCGVEPEIRECEGRVEE